MDSRDFKREQRESATVRERPKECLTKATTKRSGWIKRRRNYRAKQMIINLETGLYGKKDG